MYTRTSFPWLILVVILLVGGGTTWFLTSPRTAPAPAAQAPQPAPAPAAQAPQPAQVKVIEREKPVYITVHAPPATPAPAVTPAPAAPAPAPAQPAPTPTPATPDLQKQVEAAQLAASRSGSSADIAKEFAEKSAAAAKAAATSAETATTAKNAAEKAAKEAAESATVSAKKIAQAAAAQTPTQPTQTTTQPAAKSTCVIPTTTPWATAYGNWWDSSKCAWIPGSAPSDQVGLVFINPPNTQNIINPPVFPGYVSTPPSTTTISGRRASGEWTSIRFSYGEVVLGYRIVLDDGRLCEGGCYLQFAPTGGHVTSGVVYPWQQEISEQISQGRVRRWVP